TDYAEGAQRQRDDVDVLAARDHALANGLEPPALPVQPNEPNVEVIDPQLLEIFRQEALGHLGTLDRFHESAEQSSSHWISDSRVRALDNLRGRAHMAG
ncbi:hypothetical protein, partial [Pseudomonas viridiflava]|uniref:hypothetical protein n=1 Tax=Pseudomonas viridiflava TaxID=33069 RepID=UPI0013CEB771